MASGRLKVFKMFSVGKEQRWRYFLKRMLVKTYTLPRYFMLSLGGVNTMTSDSFLDTKTERIANWETIPSFVDNKNNNANHSLPMTFEPNDPRLRSSECLINAAGLAVDSSSAVLSQTVYAVIDIERQYVELLNVLEVLMERQLQVLDYQAEQERVADIIMETNHEIDHVYRRKQDLALLFASVKILADATAAVAFATGATYASTSIGERLHSAEMEIQKVLAVSEEAEKNLQAIKVKSIEVMSQHERAKSKKNKQTD